jgi:pyruvate,water dikinase
MGKLQSIALGAKEDYRERFVRHGDTATALFLSKGEFTAWLKAFEGAYVDVFRVNILAEKTLADLAHCARTHSLSVLNLLATPHQGAHEHHLQTDMIAKLRQYMCGNSLDIVDMGPFITEEKVSTNDHQTAEILEKLSPKRRTDVMHLISDAQDCLTLREEGRWVTVAFMSGLREALFRLGAQQEVKQSLLFFSTLDDAQKGRLKEEDLTKRKRDYDAWNSLSFPKTIASIPAPSSPERYSIAPGQASGVLRRPSDDLHKGDIILVDALFPELTRYFGIVGGIVAREGGILSHLAIVAREYGIPVVVDTRADVDALLEKNVTLFGDKGIVEECRTM